MPAFGFGMRPRGPKHPAQTSDPAHHIGRGNRNIEVGHPAFDLLQGLIVVSNHVRAGIASRSCALARGKDQHAHGFAQSMWQHHDIPHLLVGLARIERRAHVHFNAGIELSVGRLFCESDAFARQILLFEIDLGQCGPIFLSWFWHIILRGVSVAPWRHSHILFLNRDAHRTRRAFDLLHGAFDIDRV